MFLNLPINLFVKSKKLVQELYKNSIFCIGHLLYYFPVKYTECKNSYFFDKNELHFDEEQVYIVNIFIKKIFSTNTFTKVSFRIVNHFESNLESQCIFFNSLFINNFIRENQYFNIKGKYSKKFFAFVNPEIRANLNRKTKYTIEPHYKIKSLAKWFAENSHILHLANSRDGERFKQVFLLHFPKRFEDITNAKRYIQMERYKMLCLKHQYANMQILNFSKFKFSPSKFFESMSDNTCFQTLFETQRKCVFDIINQMYQFGYMKGVLQGEVGSGKTYVSLFISLYAVLNGLKICFISPTKILSEQTYNVFNTMFKQMQFDRIKLASIQTSEQLNSNDIDIAFSTVLLAYARKKIEYEFDMLFLDEEQKFGIQHRSNMSLDVQNILYMTATPIPRTYQMIQLGILKLFQLQDRVRNVETILLFSQNWQHTMLQHINAGHKILIVVPYLKKNHDFNIKNISEFLKQHDVAFDIMHSGISLENQIEVVRNLKQNHINVCLATNIVEIGIDIPELRHIFIFGAENFGMSSLHQMRGRIGRDFDNEKTSYCYLIPSVLNDDIVQRLNLFIKTCSGLELAKLDYENRGGGNLTGFKQTGFKQNILGWNFRDDEYDMEHIKYILNEFNIIFPSNEFTEDNII